jgi:hypothetical protein
VASVPLALAAVLARWRYGDRGAVSEAPSAE